MDKFVVRALSGIIYAGIIVGCILLGSNGVIILASILAILATIEFAKICHEFSSRNLPALLLDIAGCLCLCMATYGFPVFLWIFILLIRFIEELYIKSDDPLKNLSHSMLSQLYIGLPLGCMVALANLFVTPMLLLAIFLFIWINDTGAFIIGVTFGKHRLFERISPKKSWEGFFGGVCFNVIASICFGKYLSGFFGLSGNLFLWIGLGLVVTLFSTWGDLVESMIKRNLKIKDSGNFIPGHGGILDRIDSLLFAAPAALLYLFCYLSLF